MHSSAPENRPILITGGSGFVGSALATRLVQLGEYVVTLDNFAVGRRDSLRNLSSDLLTVIEGDIRDEDQLRRVVACYRPRAVVHLAALHFIPYCLAHPIETLQVNVAGTQVLLEACRASSVERIIAASSAAVYKPKAAAHHEADDLKPTEIYGVSKLLGEHLLSLFEEETSIPCARVRLFNVYGPGETNPHVIPEIIDQLRLGNELQLGTTSSFRDLIHVQDVAAAIEALLHVKQAVSGPVNIGSGDEHSVDELVDMLRVELGRPLTIIHDERRIRKIDRPHLRADISHIRTLVGWHPAVTLVDGLRELVGVLSGPVDLAE